jgi:hypothetical protein
MGPLRVFSAGIYTEESPSICHDSRDSVRFFGIMAKEASGSREPPQTMKPFVEIGQYCSIIQVQNRTDYSKATAGGINHPFTPMPCRADTALGTLLIWNYCAEGCPGETANPTHPMEAPLTRIDASWRRCGRWRHGAASAMSAGLRTCARRARREGFLDTLRPQGEMER